MWKARFLILVVVAILILVTWAFWRVFYHTETGIGGRIDWADIDTTLASGKVAMVAQTHQGEVIVTFKDGTQVKTTTPELDLIFEKIRYCGAPCKDIVQAME